MTRKLSTPETGAGPILPLFSARSSHASISVTFGSPPPSAKKEAGKETEGGVDGGEALSHVRVIIEALPPVGREARSRGPGRGTAGRRGPGGRSHRINTPPPTSNSPRTRTHGNSFG